MRHKPTRPKENLKQIDFLIDCDVPEILYGGAAGGGKSEALLMAALQFVEVPGYAAILFRKTYADLALPGALMDKAFTVLSNTAAHWNGQEKVWTFPSGATLSFGYLAEENDRFRYQSSEFQYIGFDELTQFKERDYRYLWSRRRRLEGSQVPLRMRAASNPGGVGHLWVKKRFIRQPGPNRKFIPADLEDNPYLDQEEYERSLEELDSQTWKQLRRGDWTDFGGNHYFPSSWPRYTDTGDAYRIRDGDRWKHIRKAECSRLLCLDWAMGKPKKDAPPEIEELTGDCTAFVVADMADDRELDGMLFMLDCVNERIHMESNAPRLAEMCRRWNPVVVAADDDNLTETMHLECRRFRDIPSIKSVPIRSKNKLTRSQAAIVRGERGKIYLPDRDYDWVDVLCDNLSAFTGADGEADDVADTVSILGRLADEFRPHEDQEPYEPIVGAEGYSGDIYGGANGFTY